MCSVRIGPFRFVSLYLFSAIEKQATATQFWWNALIRNKSSKKSFTFSLPRHRFVLSLIFLSVSFFAFSWTELDLCACVCAFCLYPTRFQIQIQNKQIHTILHVKLYKSRNEREKQTKFVGRTPWQIHKYFSFPSVTRIMRSISIFGSLPLSVIYRIDRTAVVVAIQFSMHLAVDVCACARCSFLSLFSISRSLN